MNWILAIVVLVIVVALFASKRMSFVPEETARKLLKEGAVVVDVRGKDEFQSGHLPGALNIPLGELSASVPRQFPDKNCVLLLHCQSGMRSRNGQRQLRRLGYTNVFTLGSLTRAKQTVNEHRNP